MESVTLIANADLRLEANRMAWPIQQDAEGRFSAVLAELGVDVVRGHDFDSVKQHGFIDSQRNGMEVFGSVPPDRPLIVLLTTWQYSHHILHGLLTHKAPILTIANWSGTYPGLVGLLNLNASLTKAGCAYSTLWSADFRDDYFLQRLSSWIAEGSIEHDSSHVRRYSPNDFPSAAVATGLRLGKTLLKEKAILGVFDEGCMGMFNAIIPDHLLNVTGIFKERLSQSALYFETMQIDDATAEESLDWLESRGVTFITGADETTDLTRSQVLLQLKMYHASLRMADDFGCDAIGIQYQQGLKDLLPASDLAEGLLNNLDRPPSAGRNGGRILFDGQALPHFNEVDECAGVDALVTNRVWSALGFDPATTLHDVRWGDIFEDDFVWVFEISGAAPPSHFIDGYRGASCMRQLPMYFRLGGATLRGICRPGEIVWSRVFIDDGTLCADLGRGHVANLPDKETERRWRATSYEWPIMHGVLHGISQNQFMARHKSNHVQVAYAPTAADADRALAAKASFFDAIGIETYICGDAGSPQ